MTTPSLAYAQYSGTLVPVYQFTDGADGGNPIGSVVRDAAGVLYGETNLGGTGTCTSKAGNPLLGCGTIYSYSTTTGLKVLANFTGANGAYGQGTLTLAGSTLYGTTAYGGANDLGTIFSIQTDGSNFTLLHQFSGTDGRSPGPQLLVGAGGVLYGITELGGINNNGVLFSLSPSGTYRLLHKFLGEKDGSEPFSLRMPASGTLLGSAFQGGGTNKYCPDGCGTLFEYNLASGHYSSPYSYTAGGGQGGVIGGVTSGQTVYGASEYFVYTISAATGYVDQGEFDVLEAGDVSSPPFLLSDGSFLGVNSAGPEQNGGLIYSAANKVITPLIYFGGAAGYDPFSQPLLLPGNQLIGTASFGGLCTNCGTIWSYTQ